MFSKTKKNKQPINQQPRSVPSIISTDLKITGDLVSSGEIQVDGEVTGDIKSNVLLVGETATVTGEIRAETIRVHGRINGQIRATFVNLAKTAHVVGDILHENISIQEGAFLEGHIKHMSEEQIQHAKADMKQDKPADDRVNLVVKSGDRGAKSGAPSAPTSTNTTNTTHTPNTAAKTEAPAQPKSPEAKTA